MNMLDVNRRAYELQISRAFKQRRWKTAIDIMTNHILTCGYFVCKTSAKVRFGLKEKDFDRLYCLEVPNPHYKTGKYPMRLYLIKELETKFLNGE